MIKRTDIINFIIDRFNYNNYLEIGVYDITVNFNKINAKHKTSVDPKPIGECDYRITSDDFFNIYNINKTYDVIFIDGLHTSEQVYKDIKNSLMCLNEDGFIIVHDCNPTQEYYTRSYDEYLLGNGAWTGDVFKGFIRIKNELPEYSCFVVNEDYGCGIITKQHILKNTTFDLDISNINWKLFDINRVGLLQLIEYDEFINLF